MFGCIVGHICVTEFWNKHLETESKDGDSEFYKLSTADGYVRHLVVQAPRRFDEKWHIYSVNLSEKERIYLLM